jgi:hypothetical protein
MKKAQMSFEMVIGLLILLVVAAVVINLFLGNIKGITSVKKYQDDLDYKNFKSECDGYCKDGSEGALVSFCSKKLAKKTDINGNGIIDVLQSDSSVLPMCEDAIYCFLATSCERDTGKISFNECRQILCKAWNDVYDDPVKASCKVNELIPTWGTCKLKVDENWFKIAGFGKDACGAVCTG